MIRNKKFIFLKMRNKCSNIKYLFDYWKSHTIDPKILSSK